MALCGGITGLGGDQAPQFIEVDSGAEALVGLEMEVTLSLFTEVTGMTKKSQIVLEEGAFRYLLFLHHDSVVMHTTGVSSTSTMLSVSTDTTVTHGHVTSHVSHLS